MATLPVRLDTLGTHWSREALTVPGAGLVTLVEAAVLVAPSHLARLATADLNAAAIVLAVVSAVAGATIVGYVGRSLLWVVADAVRGGWTPAKDEALVAHLQDRFADGDLRRILAPVLHDEEPMRLRRGHWPFCKFWLRVHRPQLGVDDLETDINISYALVVPTLLAGPAVLRLLDHVGAASTSGPGYALAVAIAALPAYVLFARGLGKQREEAERALENYVAANLFAAPPDAHPENAQH